MATNRVYRDKDNNKKEEVEYHNIVVFGRQAETTAQYLRKGNSALVEGRLQTRSWEQDGQKKYRTEIVADRIQFGEKRAGGEGYSAGAPSAQEPSSAPKHDVIDYPIDEINPDDIPF
jgi:single-strand DNA-binding protein